MNRTSLLPCFLLVASVAVADDPQPPLATSIPATGGAENTPPRSDKGKATAVTRDNLDLDTTTITGNRELPKVMYVVPWKKADIGDLSGRPVNSLLDEVLAPVDRSVFRRQLSYFDEIDPDRPGPDLPGGDAEPAH